MFLLTLGFDRFITYEAVVVIHLVRNFYHKMNNKTNPFEEYVNFDDVTKRQNKYFKIFIFLFVIIIAVFLCFVSFKISK